MPRPVRNARLPRSARTSPPNGRAWYPGPTSPATHRTAPGSPFRVVGPPGPRPSVPRGYHAPLARRAPTARRGHPARRLRLLWRAKMPNRPHPGPLGRLGRLRERTGRLRRWAGRLRQHRIHPAAQQPPDQRKHHVQGNSYIYASRRRRPLRPKAPKTPLVLPRAPSGQLRVWPAPAAARSIATPRRRPLWW
jgi:hypothetical protein